MKFTQRNTTIVCNCKFNPSIFITIRNNTNYIIELKITLTKVDMAIKIKIEMEMEMHLHVNGKEH